MPNDLPPKEGAGEDFAISLELIVEAVTSNNQYPGLLGAGRQGRRGEIIMSGPHRSHFDQSFSFGLIDPGGSEVNIFFVAAAGIVFPAAEENIPPPLLRVVGE
mgnify:CR=1 FL=1